jgi:hypothetical protein
MGRWGGRYLWNRIVGGVAVGVIMLIIYTVKDLF